MGDIKISDADLLDVTEAKKLVRTSACAASVPPPRSMMLLASCLGGLSILDRDYNIHTWWRVLVSILSKAFNSYQSNLNTAGNYEI